MVARLPEDLVHTVDLSAFDDLNIQPVDFRHFDTMSAKRRADFARHDFGPQLEKHGFIQMDCGHMTPGIYDALIRAQESFFALPQREKDRFDGADLNNYERGYKPLDLFLRFKGEIKETFQVGPDKQMRELAKNFNHVAIPDNIWPEQSLIPDFMAAVRDFYDARTKQMELYMRSMALYLGLAEDKLLEKSGYAENVLRLLYYPGARQCRAAMLKRDFNESGLTWAKAHSDISFGTLLKGEAGLQIWDGEEKQWLNVVTDPDKTLVNTGLCSEIMSNGLLPATPHRVVVPKNAMDQDRYAAPFFFHLNPDFKLTPSEDSLNKRGGKNYYPETVAVQDLVLNIGAKEYTRRREQLLNP